MHKIAVRLSGDTNRYQACTIVYLWCMKNKITAFHDELTYMFGTTESGRTVTTYWDVPDEQERTLFILKWCK